MQKKTADHSGKCTCGAVRYELLAKPLFVHCCHCSWCQRETGTAFVLNALIEAEKLALLCGEIETTTLPSSSGAGQILYRCTQCKIVVWSHYSGAGEVIKIVRVGTLDKPDLCPPDIHIFTATRQRWVVLDDTIPVVEEYYRRSEYWPAESIERYRKAVVKN